MRWVHITVLAVLGFITLVFAIQNLQSVTVHFFNLSVTLPMAILIVLIYVVGAITGSSVQSLIRWGIRGARGLPPSTPAAY